MAVASVVFVAVAPMVPVAVTAVVFASAPSMVFVATTAVMLGVRAIRLAAPLALGSAASHRVLLAVFFRPPAEGRRGDFGSERAPGRIALRGLDDCGTAEVRVAAPIIAGGGPGPAPPRLPAVSARVAAVVRRSTFGLRRRAGLGASRAQVGCALVPPAEGAAAPVRVDVAPRAVAGPVTPPQVVKVVRAVPGRGVAPTTFTLPGRARPASHALCSPSSTSIRLPRLSGALGIVTVSTPFSNRALIRSGSTLRGRVNEREKLPYRRS